MHRSKVWKCTVCQVNNDDFITESTNVPTVHPLPSFTFTAVPPEGTTSGPSTSSATKHQSVAPVKDATAAIDSPAPPQERTAPPPAWLDALIGLCVTLLLYILYHKYM